MNLVLTRNNQRHVNVSWEPFATSTPLKVVPNNVNLEKESKKQFQICADSLDIIRKLEKGRSSGNITVEKPNDCKQSVSKRPRKNKSCANFDFSSSSDEDNASERRRPVIKLSFKKPTNILAKNKKSEAEGVKFEKNITTSSNHTITSIETNKCDIKSLKLDHNNTYNNENKKQDESLNLSSDEENQIFDKIINSSNVTTETLTRINENCTNNSERATTNKQKTCISSSTKKFMNVENQVSITRSKKVKNKLGTPNNTSDNAITPLKILENKTNVSHQLFSDSKEQELINVLDLTTEEVGEAVENKGSFLWQIKKKLVANSITSPHPSNQSNASEKQKEIKPKKKQNLRKCLLTKNLSNGQLGFADGVNECQLKKNLRIVNDEHVDELESSKKTEVICEGLTENNSKENDLSFKKVEKKAKKKGVNVAGKKKKALAPNSAEDVKLGKTDVNSATSSSDSVKSATKTEKLSQPARDAKDEKTTTAEKPVFKLLSELTYKEDETGCSAAECWDVNTFKCGVFKLKINSQMKCKTLHKNSHLGGVLIKGKLKMKIGSKELDLNQGDMAFVPPLTEWQATNIGKCESAFYYWCGRFKT